MISIHEAAKASTSLGFILHDISYNFNPRSRKGFDNLYPFSMRVLSNFNPRSRKGFDDREGYGSGETEEFQSTKPQRLRHKGMNDNKTSAGFQSTKPQRLRPVLGNTSSSTRIFQSTKPQRLRRRTGISSSISRCISIHEAAKASTMHISICTQLIRFQSTKPQRLRQQKHPKNNLIFKNNLYTYYNIPAHNNYILIILNLFTIKSTIFQVRISRDFHVHFLFAPNNSILKYHN